MTIYLLRASHANEFELQNYAPIAHKFGIQVVTSHHPLTPISLPRTELWSPTDLPHFPLRRQLLNRAIGGEQWLFGLEQLLASHYHDSNHSSKSSGIILHTAETYTPYTHQAVQMRKRGIIHKLICTCWETIPSNNEKFGRLRQWKQEAYQYIDLFHTPTERAKQALVGEGVDPQKIVVIPYGVDLTNFKPAKSKPRNKKPVVLMVARPVREKGIELYSQLSQDLANQAEFRLSSDVPYASMPKIYQSADVFLLPSLATPTWEEQYGMALVEAMACGLPIITTSSGAIPEVVGNAGLISSPTDYESLKSHLCQALSDPVLCSHLAARSLARARHRYDSRRVSTRLAQLYR